MDGPILPHHLPMHRHRPRRCSRDRDLRSGGLWLGQPRVYLQQHWLVVDWGSVPLIGMDRRTNHRCFCSSAGLEQEERFACIDPVADRIDCGQCLRMQGDPVHKTDTGKSRENIAAVHADVIFLPVNL